MAGRLFATAVAVILLGGATMPALALDYRSVTEPAVLFAGPSDKAQRLYVIAPLTPVELVLTQPGGWSRIRDQKGDMIWIESRFLSPRRMLMVRAERAQVRSQADEKSPLVFEAEKDVVLELMTDPAPSGWARVRHRNGQSGFAKVAQVWGY